MTDKPLISFDYGTPIQAKDKGSESLPDPN